MNGIMLLSYLMQHVALQATLPLQQHIAQQQHCHIGTTQRSARRWSHAAGKGAGCHLDAASCTFAAETAEHWSTADASSKSMLWLRGSQHAV